MSAVKHLGLGLALDSPLCHYGMDGDHGAACLCFEWKNFEKIRKMYLAFLNAFDFLFASEKISKSGSLRIL
jgi:hypothetical protein